MRKNFAQAMSEKIIDIRQEYTRLFHLFFDENLNEKTGAKAFGFTICPYKAIENYFLFLRFRGTTVSIQDFNKERGFVFLANPVSLSNDDLVKLCEYVFNLSHEYIVVRHLTLPSAMCWNNLLAHIQKVIDLIGYVPIKDNGFTIFVEKDATVGAVAKIVPEEVSGKVFSYRHYSLKGNIEEKKSILVKLAFLLEPQRKVLKGIDNQLSDDLFEAFNTLNIRHNNVDPRDKGKYRRIVAEMDIVELEKWYDVVYEMCLLAFMHLDYAKYKSGFKELLNKVNKKE